MFPFSSFSFFFDKTPLFPSLTLYVSFNAFHHPISDSHQSCQASIKKTQSSKRLLLLLQQLQQIKSDQLHPQHRLKSDPLEAVKDAATSATTPVSDKATKIFGAFTTETPKKDEAKETSTSSTSTPSRNLFLEDLLLVRRVLVLGLLHLLLVDLVPHLHLPLKRKKKQGRGSSLDILK